MHIFKGLLFVNLKCFNILMDTRNIRCVTTIELVPTLLGDLLDHCDKPASKEGKLIEL